MKFEKNNRVIKNKFFILYFEMHLKVQIISYDVLIAGLFFLVRNEKNKFLQIFTYTQNKHTLNPSIAHQIFIQKVQKKEKIAGL
jgi:hypothetical protein